MAAEKWSQVKGILDAAIRRKPEERAAFLDEACNGDESVRLEVESLLSSFGRAEGFMEKPAFDAETEEMRSLPTGQVIGHYEIVRRLGEGGMGVVYLAKDTILDRYVAIKVLNKRYERHEENVRRFMQEAKAASALNHPNILTIYEIAEFEGSQYIVNEYIEGETLREILGKGIPDLGRVTDIAIQTASALAAAHKARIIHRDIKPENIIVRDDGYVKVLDFGLAKLLPSQVSTIGLDDTKRQNQTAEGVILGTVSYMSPEQAKGEMVDERTDIFSLGVLVYEMIAGRTPFAGASMSETFANLINKDPAPLSRFSGGVPDELQRIVSKMLRKDPDQRYQTMKGLLADLKELKDHATFEAKLDRASLQGSDGDTAVMTRTTGDVQQSTAETRKATLSWYRRPVLFASLAVVLIGALVVGWYWRSAINTGPQIKSLAVLPLENLSGDPAQEYFADGMTEALISDLSRIRALKVTARRSVMAYKGSRESLQLIATKLGVDAVIEGTVQRSGGRVRISTQLIPAGSDSPIWSRTYEREQLDILKLQSDVAQAIAGEIRVQVTVAEQNRLDSVKPIDPKAHEAYLLGKYYLAKSGEAYISKSIENFQQAIVIDPNYADAYAGLAAALLDRGIWGTVQNLAAVEPEMRSAATMAIKIDPDNALAHVAMCQLLNNYDYDWAGAEEEAKHALAIDPNSVEALTAYAWLLQSLGRHEEARVMIEKAEQLDPVASYIQSAFGRIRYRARDYAEAERHLLRAIELDPAEYSAYGRLGDVYIEMGRFDDAVAQFEESQRMQPTGAHVLRLAIAYARMGDRRRALKAFAAFTNRSGWETARLYTALSEPDKAFEVLDKALERRDALLVHLKEDPSFDPLHSDPRWKTLMHRLNFPEE